MEHTRCDDCGQKKNDLISFKVWGCEFGSTDLRDWTLNTEILCEDCEQDTYVCDNCEALMRGSLDYMPDDASLYNMCPTCAGKWLSGKPCEECGHLINTDTVGLWEYDRRHDVWKKSEPCLCIRCSDVYWSCEICNDLIENNNIDYNHGQVLCPDCSCAKTVTRPDQLIRSIRASALVMAELFGTIQADLIDLASNIPGIKEEVNQQHTAAQEAKRRVPANVWASRSLAGQITEHTTLTEQDIENLEKITASLSGVIETWEDEIESLLIKLEEDK